MKANRTHMKLILTLLIIVSILHINAQSKLKSSLSKTYTEQESLQQVVDNYNRRIAWWDKNATLIDLSKPTIIEATKGNKLVINKSAENTFAAVPNKPVVTSGPGESFDNSTLDDVVVTAMGIKRPPRVIGYGTATLGNRELTQGKVTNLATGLAAKVSGLQVNLVNSGVKPDTRITLRGNRSILGNNQALLVVDDVELPISYIGSLNPNDVDNVTVLKGAAASALYGSDASNGVIIVTTQKGNRTSDRSVWRKYKLDDAEDVDYMQEIKRTLPREYVDVYEQYKKANAKNAGFYLDMADFFFQKGMKEKALEILYKAAEASHGSIEGLKDVAYTLESWKNFDEAIGVYKNIIDENNGGEAIKRDLALAYFQNGNYQQALNTYYEIVTKRGSELTSNNNLKQIAMSEMNALIALHSDSLDLTAINLRLVRALPVDLRISVESNDRGRASLLIQEPSGELCYAADVDTRSGGQLSPANYDDEDNYSEYSIKNAAAGKYRISTNAYDGSNNAIPHIMRIIVFKNFQRAGQTIEIKNVILDNQYGEVEIGEITW